MACIAADQKYKYTSYQRTLWSSNCIESSLEEGFIKNRMNTDNEKDSDKKIDEVEMWFLGEMLKIP